MVNPRRPAACCNLNMLSEASSEVGTQNPRGLPISKKPSHYPLFHVFVSSSLSKNTCVHACLVVSVLCAAPWTVAHQASLSTESSRQECWSRVPFPTPGDRPDPGVEPDSLASPSLARGFFTTDDTFMSFTPVFVLKMNGQEEMVKGRKLASQHIKCQAQCQELGSLPKPSNLGQWGKGMGLTSSLRRFSYLTMA